MTAWIKTVDGKAIKLKDSKWRAKIYAFGEACDDPKYLESRVRAYDLIYSIKYTYKRVDILQKRKKSRVLEIQVKDPHRIKKLAEALEHAFQNPTSLKQYNVDVLPEQQYFYEKDLFPLAYVEVDVREDGEIRKWNVLDSVTSYTYETPKLQTLRIAIEISDLVPKMDSKLLSISLYSPDDNAEEKEIAKIRSTSEENILLETIKEIERTDPDLIITSNGDSFVLPFLYSKASKYSVDLSSKLNRDNLVSNNQKGGGGRTYFSYGRILYRPNTQRLYGRLHLDEQNTFVYDQCMLEGLYEVSRLCRIPIHTSMRASIGKCLSSLQFYYAFKEDILIPWKPDIVEDFKNGWELFVADRGGLVLKPLPGVHKHVGELDFASLYPSIIRKYNISAETVNCACCSNGESKYQIEELHMHICDKREGIVSRSLALPLSKRFEYKRLRDQTKDKRLKKIYNERAGSLKWILVCCLAKESPVLVKQNGVISCVKIGSFIDSIVGDKQGIIECPDDTFVAGVDHNFKSKFSKIKRLLKVPNEQRLLNITMDDGRKIIATPNHPFYQLKNGELEVKQASELKEGEFIPVAKKLPSSIQSEKFFQRLNIYQKQLSLGDLGFIKISKIEKELDRIDEYVYCFELADDEVPGFFTGDGAIFTHNCFGYLSYRNAKFGKIDSHIAVCALARKTLLDAMSTSEYNGFRVVHGIVDSLWLSKRNATLSDYEELQRKIEQDTKFKIAIEGIYKWIVFLPSKTYSGKQVANRYFGAFEGTNELKVRGIELRRHDAPLYFKKCQGEILDELKKCDNEKELRHCARWKCIEIFEKYAQDLEEHKVPSTQLIITRRLSKNLSDYSSPRQLSVNAASHLAKKGLTLQAGQSVSYVITRYKSSGVDRSLPEELLSEEEYDSQRYIELLADCCATVLFPLGVTKKELLTRSQSLLSWQSEQN
jgi:DNA polymerase elongation subunit (family B)